MHLLEEAPLAAGQNMDWQEGGGVLGEGPAAIQAWGGQVAVRHCGGLPGRLTETWTGELTSVESWVIRT